MKSKGVWWAGLTVTVSAALGLWGVNQAEVPWNLTSVHLPPASGVTFAAAHPVTVAILDTGMSEQPLLDGVQRYGYDFVTDPHNAGDGTGRDPTPLASRGGVGYHGTAVAGVVHSVNPQARLVHVRVIGRVNTVSLGDAVDGLRWAAGLDVPGVPRNPFPARVINASFSLNRGPHAGCVPAMQRAVDEVLARGTVVVTSAGNRNAPAARNTPAGCRGVITVAATDDRGRRAPYSNWGSAVALAAPGGTGQEGVDVLRPGGGETELTGTSFAAPLVAGAASLLLTERPTLSPAAVTRLLEQTAQPFTGGQCDRVNAHSCGAGVLDVSAAVRAAGTWPAALTRAPRR